MMALQDELKALFQAVAHSVGRGAQRFKYTRELCIGTLFCALLGAGYIGYRWVTVSRDQTAQKAFSEYVRDYQLALKENNPQEWERVEALFEFGRNQYSSSSLAPYFLAMQSEIFVRQGKWEQARKAISQALAELTDPKMKSMLEIKRALMQLDDQDPAIKNAGLQELVVLARDESNSYKDMALFYLGRYYWANDKLGEAKKTWQELVDGQWFDKTNQSPWVNEAKAALQQLSS